MNTLGHGSGGWRRRDFRFARFTYVVLLVGATLWMTSVAVNGYPADDSTTKEEFESLVARLCNLEGTADERARGPRPKVTRQWDETFRELQALTPDSVKSVLIPALDDPNPYARCCAATLLGLARDKRGVDPLIAALKDPDGNVRCCAALALGRIGDQRAAPPLIEALGHDDTRKRSGFRWQVEEALGYLKDPRAIEPLLEVLLAGKDSGTCYVGAPRIVYVFKREPFENASDCPPATALAQIGAPAVEGLIEALSRVEPHVRKDIAVALGNIGDPRAVGPLRKLLLDDTAPPVREAASEALRRIEEREIRRNAARDLCLIPTIKWLSKPQVEIA